MSPHRPRSGRTRDDRGAVAVEFALVLVPLTLLLLGIIDFGRAFNTQVTLTQLAREGARLASLQRTDTVSRVLAQAPSSLKLTAASITVTACPTGATVANDATVSISAPQSLVTASLIGRSSSTLTVTGRASMPCLG